MKEALQSSLKFRKWKSDLESHSIRLNSVEELTTIHKGNGELLFSMIRLDAECEDGNRLMPVALLRGHFVAILTLLREKESGAEFLLLVKQRRVANGAIFFEHPAGMVDSETDLKKVVIKELAEETGLIVNSTQIHSLTTEPIYSSPGLLDEGGYYFYVEIEMSGAEIDTYRDKKTGDPGENEFIETTVVALEDALPLLRDVNGILVLLLYLRKKRMEKEQLNS